jgi:hypothetical protein
MTAPVFILGIHKSGTSLLRNLLDGHPELTVVPIETHFPLCSGLPTLYPRILPPLAAPSVVGTLNAGMRQILESYNISSDPRADAFLPQMADLDAFDEVMASITTAMNRAEQWHISMYAVLKAYGVGKPDPTKAIVEKCVRNLEHAMWLHAIFPTARFIFITRNPYANLHSMRRFFAPDGYFPSLSQPLRVVEMGFHFAALYQQILPNLRIVRYEDLVSEPMQQMTLIAEHLDIGMNDSMLRPSSLGADWKGNSTTGVTMDGVSSERLNKWQSTITPIEVDLVNRSRIIQEHMAHWSYAPFSRGNSFQWNKGETVRTYLRNRLFRMFADGS